MEAATLHEVVMALRQQQLLLEQLLFRMTVLRLLTRAGEHHLVPRACEDVHRAAEQLDCAEHRRRQALENAAEQLGAGCDPISVTALADNSPEPYRYVLHDHVGAITRTLRSLIGVIAGDVPDRASRRIDLDEPASDPVDPLLTQVFAEVSATRASAAASTVAQQEFAQLHDS